MRSVMVAEVTEDKAGEVWHVSARGLMRTGNDGVEGAGLAALQQECR